MLFVRYLSDCRKQLVLKAKQMIADNEVDTPEYAQVEAMLDAVNTMRDYITNGKWGRRLTRDKYVFWIKSHMNYSLTARKYNTKAKSIRVLVSRTDQKLKSIMGNPLELIMSGKVNDGLLDFYIAINKFDLNSLFGVSVWEMMPDAQNSSDCFALDECQAEIQFLRDFNAPAIRDRVKSLDGSKLAYLLYIATTNDPVFYGERKRLIKQVIDIE